MLFFVFIALVAYHSVAVYEMGNKFVIRAKISAVRVVRDIQNRLVEDICPLQCAAATWQVGVALSQQAVIVAGKSLRDIRLEAALTSVPHPPYQALPVRRHAVKKPAQRPTRSHH